MGIAARKPQPAIVQKTEWNHGVPQKGEAQLLEYNKDPRANGYDGCNSCWREGHGHREMEWQD